MEVDAIYNLVVEELQNHPDPKMRAKFAHLSKIDPETDEQRQLESEWKAQLEEHKRAQL